jgi:hypothetical protein
MYLLDLEVELPAHRAFYRLMVYAANWGLMADF